MLFSLHKVLKFTHKEFLGDISYFLSFLMRWVGLILSVIVFYFLSKMMGRGNITSLDIYGGDYFSFMLVSLAAVSIFTSAMNGLPATVGREQSAGTLEIILSTPTSFAELICAFSLYNLLMGTLVAIGCVILGAFLGVSLAGINYSSITLILFLSIIIFINIGLLSTACLIAFKRGDPISWMAGNIFWLLGGFYFPISVFPEVIQKLSYYLPSTYAFHALRLALLKGYSVSMLSREINALGLFAVVLSVAGIMIFKYALCYAQKRGTIFFQ